MDKGSHQGDSVKAKQKSKREICNKALNRVDIFSKSFSQRIDGGDPKTVGTLFGTVLTLILTVIVVGYSIYKCDVMVNRKSSESNLFRLRDFYTEEEEFSSNDGFNIAIGLDYSILVNGEIDETYFTIHAVSEVWGFDDNGQFYFYEYNHSMSKCSSQ